MKEISALYEAEQNAVQAAKEKTVKQKGKQQKDIEPISEEKILSPAEKRYMQLVAGFIAIPDQTDHIDYIRKIAVRDISKMIHDLHDEIDLKTQIRAALERENAPLDRFFDHTKDYARTLIKSHAFMEKLRSSLQSMSNKFHTAQLNPLKQHAYFMRQMIQMSDFIHAKEKEKEYVTLSDFKQFRDENQITIEQYDQYFTDSIDEKIRKQSMRSAIAAIRGDQKIMDADR